MHQHHRNPTLAQHTNGTELHAPNYLHSGTRNQCFSTTYPRHLQRFSATIGTRPTYLRYTNHVQSQKQRLEGKSLNRTSENGTRNGTNGHICFTITRIRTWILSNSMDAPGKASPSLCQNKGSIRIREAQTR